MAQHSTTTLSSRQLLHLPDELLSMIVMETMWECTLEDRTPDLVSYQRRLTNHPSIQLKKVAFLGGICGRLRGIYKELVHVPTLWTGPNWSERKAYRGSSDNTMPTLLPSSILCDQLAGVALLHREIGYFPLLPQSTLAQLVELELYGRGDRLTEDLALSGTLLQSPSLKTLVLDNIGWVAKGQLLRVLEAVGTLPQLQHLTMGWIDDSNHPLETAGFSKLFERAWTSHVVRLEFVHVYPLPWSHFVRIMGCVRLSLAVALFGTWDDERYEPCEVGDSTNFPALWKLSINFHDGRYPQRPGKDCTEVGREQLAVLSPLEIIKKAPSLAYFDCSERLDIKTPAELAQVATLVDRDGWKRLRLRLKTWEGEKGGRWTRDEKQDVFVD